MVARVVSAMLVVAVGAYTLATVTSGCAVWFALAATVVAIGVLILEVMFDEG